MRAAISLDGEWDFNFVGEADDRAEPPAEGWRSAIVPMPWQAQFEDLRTSLGTAWYRRRFTVPAEWRDSTIVLCFGAVSYLAEVSLNGVAIGRHEGDYLPFEFPLNHAVERGAENELLVRVTAPTDDEVRYGDMAL